MAVTGVLLIGWRSAAAALTKEVSQTSSSQGMPQSTAGANPACVLVRVAACRQEVIQQVCTISALITTCHGYAVAPAHVPFVIELLCCCGQPHDKVASDMQGKLSIFGQLAPGLCHRLCMMRDPVAPTNILQIINLSCCVAVDTLQEAPMSPAAKAAARKDKQGNPLEFLQLLRSLTTRW
jgi:hypothetical protein